MSPGRRSSIIVFDGVCHLCSGWVRFLLERDKAERFTFAAMQTPAGRRLLRAHGLDPDAPVSFLLCENHVPYTDSTAIVRILAQLGGIWKIIAVPLSWIPRALRDPCYRFVARHRYRLFGRRTQCLMPEARFARRFVAE